ncbi:uncharacterized protein (DUF1800 family) [Dyadobacter arcticus]|uniref:Uncharacterized protein (DUF1800 family) n=2 Tax=Dyadobacter arcticus TaxID=1078754 RepID=A0ABX0UNT4_9BACT|nr:uncharacterized protein (DUF1800 family) [Dyadobacter arcticus]
MALLDKYDNPLTARQAAHLLRRITFGSSQESITQLAGKTTETVVGFLLSKTTAPGPPKDPANKTFHDLPWGYPATEEMEQNKNDAIRCALIKGWWIGQMLQQKSNIIEKMTLFWQNHFVSTATDVSDARFIYGQYQLLRKHALGNFRTFVIDITKDPAMLWYLNGNENVVGKPNENYGRELQELFTIGQGNYDENDVKNAARVLTGWRPVGFRNTASAEVTVEFRALRHDTGNKIFSSHYQNTVIKGRNGTSAGDLELGELVDMILRQDATALFIVRKIYRWFVQAEISPLIENEVIKPLAALFRNDYEIKPVLSQLFNSQHFYDAKLIGSQIKSPLELVIGSLSHFNQNVPDPVKDRGTYDLFTQYLAAKARELQMEVFDQPTVFGWQPYYDTDFYELWINSTTLALRGAYSDAIIKGIPALKININSLDLAKKVSDPSNPIVLVNELTNYLFAFDLTQSQKDYLIDEILIPGLPRYEWGVEWNQYISNQGDILKRNSVKRKIDNMYQYLLRLAEFQMG